MNSDDIGPAAPEEPTDGKRRGGTPPAGMAIILWSLLFLLSGFALLVSSPLDAPSFEALAAFRCDAAPMIFAGSSRSARQFTLYACRSGNQVIYQQGIPLAGPVHDQLRRCLAGGGALTLWRVPPGSPYGRITFQTACADTVYADYTTQAAKYEQTQLFLRAVLWLVAVLSSWRLAVNVWHHYQRRA